MESDTDKNTASYGVVRGRSLLLPATMVEEQRRKDVEVDALFKQCHANIARWEEERIDQMHDDMIEGYAMMGSSLRMMAWCVGIVGAIAIFVRVYAALHGGA